MSPSDSQIRQKVTGKWIADSDVSRTIENKADGSFVVRYTNAVTAEGTWYVKGRFLIGTITNASSPFATRQVESNKVVSIGDNKMVVLDYRGGTNELVFRKK